MNYFRTALLLAGLTALYMGVGFLIGGKGGAMIALVVAAATNLFTWWNSGRMVLRMYGAHEIDRSSAPDLYQLVADLASRRLAAERLTRMRTDTARTVGVGGALLIGVAAAVAALQAGARLRLVRRPAADFMSAIRDNAIPQLVIEVHGPG